MESNPSTKEQATSFRVQIALFLTVLVCCAFFRHERGDVNENSRLDLTAAIVNEGAVAIDPYHENTIDKADVDGHYYSDKAPGSSVLALPVAWAYRMARGGERLDPDDPLFRWLVVFFIVALPSALLSVLFWRAAVRLGGDPNWSLLVALGYSLGTLAFPYSTLYYSHQIVAVLLFALFLLAFDMKRAGPTLALRLVGFGFLAGLAALTEYPTVLASAVLAVMALIPCGRARALAFMALGGVPLAAVWLAYNRLAFGSWTAFGYEREYYEWFREGHKAGFVGLTLPKLDVLYRISVHPGRGLFYLCPAALVGAAAFWPWLKSGQNRIEAFTSLAIVLLFFLFNAAMFNPEGGLAAGPRYLIPMLPWLCLPAAFLERGPAGKGARIAAASLIGASVIQMAVIAATDAHAHQSIRNPVAQFCLPLLQNGLTSGNWLAAAGVGEAVSAGFFFALLLGVLFWAYRRAGLLPFGPIGAALALALTLGVFGSLSVRSERDLQQWRLGIAAEEAGRLELAESFYRRSIEINPELANALLALARLQEAKGRFGEAVALLEKAVAVRTDLLPAHYFLGMDYIRMGRDDLAEKELRLVASSDPPNEFRGLAADAAMMLGNYYFSQRRYKEAAAGYQRVLQFRPDDRAASQALSRTFRELQ